MEQGIRHGHSSRRESRICDHVLRDISSSIRPETHDKRAAMAVLRYLTEAHAIGRSDCLFAIRGVVGHKIPILRFLTQLGGAGTQRTYPSTYEYMHRARGRETISVMAINDGEQDRKEQATSFKSPCRKFG